MVEVITNSQTASRGIKHISQIDYRAIIRNHLILTYISENQFSTPYKISKALNINYATTSKVIKDLEYVNLISVRVRIGENNRTHKECYIPIKKAEVIGESVDNDPITLSNNNELNKGDENENN